MLQTRKNVLDKARTELSDTVNGANQIYTNEELSILLGEQNDKINKLTSANEQLTNKLNEKKDTMYTDNGTTSIRVYDKTYGRFFAGTQKYVVIKLGNIKFTDAFMLSTRINIYQYSYTNQIIASSYLYQTDNNFYAPAVQFTQKSNTFPVFFGRDKLSNVYIILDVNAINYLGVWVDQITTMWEKSNYDDINNGWNIYTTSDLSNMNLTTRCGVM